MSATLICDRCRQPKARVEHYSLVQHLTKANGNGRRRYAGSIDLCDDCIGRTAHDGRDSAHKIVRVEMGRTSR